MPPDLLIKIVDASSIGEARRAAARVAEAAGLSETDRGRVAVVTTELATNLLRHAAPGGQLLLAGRSAADAPAVEITSIDSGPGMADVAMCFQDGYSTGGTPGNGLGAVKRMSNESEVYTALNGTVIRAKVAAPLLGRPRTTLRAAALSLPAPGETECGDQWRLTQADGRLAAVIVDGLGHGPLAMEAADEGCKQFDHDPFASPETIIHAMHGAMSGTRGGAVAVAAIDLAAGKLTYTGVGNIAGTLLDPAGASRGLFSHNGTVGHQMRKVQTFDYPWSPGCVLVLHSDGLQTRWALDKYPGLAWRHPGLIAGVLYRDFKRGRDDATVLAIGSAEIGIN